MTEDFARDIYLLKELLKLRTIGPNEPNCQQLAILLPQIELEAGRLMEAVEQLKEAFNTRNELIVLGLWASGMVPPPAPDEKLDTSDLIHRAHKAGRILKDLFNLMKPPSASLDTLADLTKKCMTERSADLPNARWLESRLNGMKYQMDKPTFIGPQPTYWPSNYISSSSSSSSSSTYP